MDSNWVRTNFPKHKQAETLERNGTCVKVRNRPSQVNLIQIPPMSELTLRHRKLGNVQLIQMITRMY